MITSMKSLLLVAHGSRREASNDEVRQVAKRLGGEVNGAFDRVDCAFLELAEPSIPDGIRQSIQSGATQVVVLPYFLSAGRHVAEDIPDEVEIVRKERPDIDITVAPYLGAADGLTDILLQQAQAKQDSSPPVT
jgi:sirohydrochlorin ferrochelatase